jgi:oligo-1,6-glucosidase
LLEPKHPTHYAFTRSLGGKTLIVVGNFSSVPLELPLELPLAVAGELVSGNLVIGNYGEMPDVAGVPR